MDQFALLNAIWALTIIIAEVPSGASSDLLGRKKLMNATAALMVLELAVWAFAPQGDPDRLFIWLAINRVLSGLAGSAASGADEALVYDSLKKRVLKIADAGAGSNDKMEISCLCWGDGNRRCCIRYTASAAVAQFVGS